MLGVISGRVVVMTSGASSWANVCFIKNRSNVMRTAFKIKPVIFSLPVFFIFIFGNILLPCR